MTRGRLRVYLGAAPGVGKTYAMLDEGWRRHQRGTDVIVGFVETHGRQKTAAQLRDLEIVPRRTIEYRGATVEELDVDAVVERRPAVALVDELAHTNVAGSRNEKRWQDVDEILEAGIDVITTVNVQHLASLNDVVEQIAGVAQRETVPDSVVRAADQIELVDMSPEALRRRMAHGNIYPPERVDTALAHYFRVGNLGALRELALLWVSDRVDDELQQYREHYGISEPWETKERVVVAITGAPNGERLIRRGARMAARANGELVGLHVQPTDGLARGDSELLDAQRALLAELGGRYAEVSGADVAAALVGFARSENASQLVLGASGRSRWSELARGSVINRAIRDAHGIDVHVISGADADTGVSVRVPRPQSVSPFSARRRAVAWSLAIVGIPAIALALAPFRTSFGLPGALLFLLLGAVIVTLFGGIAPAIAALALGAALGDFFFTVPYHSFRMARVADVLAVVVFLAVGGIVSVVVDRLARRGMQINRSRVEAEALARLAGGRVLAAGEGLPDLVAELRRTFALDAVAVLERAGDGWRPIAVAGNAAPETPEAAGFSVELEAGTVLVMSGSVLDADDSRLLHAFVAQLRMVQERAVLEARAASATEREQVEDLRTALLTAAVHDLRSPVGSIRTAVSSLLADRSAWSRPELEQFAETVDEESIRLTQLGRNLLDVCRLQNGSFELELAPLVVAEVLREAVGSLGPVSAGVVIDVEPALRVEADRKLLRRVFANVIENAVAWSPAGTLVRVNAGIAGDHVEVRVIDRGPGIPPSRREAVFLPFERPGETGVADGDADLADIGLGLAVARGLVEAIGGSIAIEDTPGGGATVVCSLRQVVA